MPNSRGGARAAHTGGGGGGESDPPGRLRLALVFLGFYGFLRLWRDHNADFAEASTSQSLSYRAIFNDRRRGLDLAPIPTAGSTTPAYS
jgi:hypothetical protein